MTLDDYLDLPYAVDVLPDVCEANVQCYLASHPELPGCMSHGITADDAVTNLREAREMYIRSLLKRGLPVPLPVDQSCRTATRTTHVQPQVKWHTYIVSQDRSQDGSLAVVPHTHPDICVCTWEGM